MRRGNLKFYVVFIAILGLPLVAHSQENQTEQWVACKKMNRLGLMDQCESVRILKRVGQRVRVYSFNSMKVLSKRDSEVFRLENIDRGGIVASNQRVVIPGNLLGYSQSQKVQSLCENSHPSQRAVLQLDCGLTRTQKVNRKLIKILGKSYRALYPQPEHDLKLLQTESPTKKSG